MKAQIVQSQIQTAEVSTKGRLPTYETPRIQAMSEKEILNSFQITQSMGGWWNIASC